MFGAFAPLPERLGGTAEDGRTAAQHARLCADLVACKRAMPLAAWAFVQDPASPYAVAILSYVGQNGVGSAYAPTVTVNGLGDVTFVWSAGYFEDDYEQQHPYKVRAARATGYSRSLTLNDTVSNVQLLARGVRVYTTDSSSGAAVASTVAVRVW